MPWRGCTECRVGSRQASLEFCRRRKATWCCQHSAGHYQLGFSPSSPSKARLEVATGISRLAAKCSTSARSRNSEKAASRKEKEKQKEKKEP